MNAVRRPQITEPSGLEDLIKEVERKKRYGPLLMTEAAADAIGVSRQTLVRWRTKKRLRPYFILLRGAQQFPLYGPEEIATGRRMKGTIPPGPEPGFTRPKKKTPVKRKVTRGNRQARQAG